MPEDLQRLLPQYEIIGILGRGGMGAVYKGRQTKLDRDVAIKVLGLNRAERDSLPPGSPAGVSAGAAGAKQTFTKGEDELNFAKRFEQEAQAMANLDHPAILSVYDFGETAEGQLYFVMEFIDGMDIHQYLKHHGGKLPQESALAITAHVLDALDYAHNHGIVHRDIKPANILLNHEGRVKIADFGLAKKFGVHADADAPALTISNVAVGTPDFVAPEALDSDQVPDHRADLYAVGVMLYQMLTGKLPRGSFQLPSELNPEIDSRLDEIVTKATASHPDYRYATAAAMRAELDRVLSEPLAKVEAGEASGAVAAVVPVTTSVKGKKAAKESSKLPVYIGVGLAAAAVVGIVVFATRGGKEVSEGKGAPEHVVVAVEEKVAPASPPVTSVEARESSTGILPVSSEGDAFGVAAMGVRSDSTGPSTESIGKMPMPLEKVSPPPAETGLAEILPEATTEPTPAETPPTAAMPSPTEQGTASTTPNQEPSTKNEELPAIPGLQVRIEAYLTARRTQLTDLATKYARGLDARFNQAADSGDLVTSWAFQAEKDHLAAFQESLAEAPVDPVAAVREAGQLPDLPEGSPESLLALRATWNTERAKIFDDLDGKLRQSLQALEAELTRARDLEKAGVVLAYRESLGEGSAGTSARTESAEVAAASPVASNPPASPPSVKQLAVTDNPLRATKDAPFENGLGMKFVPVPGTDVLFCIHETRWRDYAAYAENAEGVDPNWRKQTHDGFVVEDSPEDHPVVYVSWEDARAFCQWLSEKEGKTYRLPTDREWSLAVGIGREEDWKRDTTPSTVAKPQDIFPWGKEWPPLRNAGNYSDESRRDKAYSDSSQYLERYDDAFPSTAPVMRFKPNKLGLYDMGGNVWEWVEDWYSDEQREPVLRGGSWINNERRHLLSSHRARTGTANRNNDRGFRVVLVVSGDGASPR